MFQMEVQRLVLPTHFFRFAKNICLCRMPTTPKGSKSYQVYYIALGSHQCGYNRMIRFYQCSSLLSSEARRPRWGWEGRMLEKMQALQTLQKVQKLLKVYKLQALQKLQKFKNFLKGVGRPKPFIIWAIINTIAKLYLGPPSFYLWKSGAKEFQGVHPLSNM